jgi:hypothetical protein
VTTREQPRLVQVVVGGLLVVIGILWLFDAVTSLDVRWEILLPAALVVIGGALVYGSATGTYGGLITLGVILTIIIVLSSGLEVVLDVPFEGGIGERDHAPEGVAEDAYRLAIGDMTVDLTEATADGRQISISVGIGNLIVIIPEDAEYTIHARAGLGQVVVLDDAESGVGPEIDASSDGDGELFDLVVEVGMGKVEVTEP